MHMHTCAHVHTHIQNQEDRPQVSYWRCALLDWKDQLHFTHTTSLMDNLKNDIVLVPVGWSSHAAVARDKEIKKHGQIHRIQSGPDRDVIQSKHVGDVNAG